mmetsp:Transcript_30966/g.48494  ORF Transcript_30966/g.48494 Transcript_30966/m.48494 type:complete len:231 (-) Transcript_30966:207-899(-)
MLSEQTIKEEKMDSDSSSIIIKDLNEKHPNILVALVVANIKNGATPTQINARKITANTLTISYVECEGTMCALNSVDVAFNPPIKSADDAIDRIVTDGKIAMEAQCTWLVTEPLPLVILAVTAALGYTTLVLGEDGLQSAIQSWPLIGQKIISTIFGSYFFGVVRASFYFAIVAHAAEAIYIAIMLRKRASLGYLVCLKWFALICFVGYPLTKKAVLYTNANESKEDKLD